MDAFFVSKGTEKENNYIIYDYQNTFLLLQQ